MGLRVLSASAVVLMGCLCPALASAEETTESETEEDAVRASPEVQSQVGMGTEKEEATPEPGKQAPPPAEEGDQAAAPAEEDFGHFGQFGIRIGYSPGYKVQLRFEDSPPCPLQDDGEGELDVCGYGTAGALDMAVSFALLDAIEPYLWMRLGLGEDDTTMTQAAQYFGAGVRIYTMSDSKLKLFFEPALAMETEGATDDAPNDRKYDTDFVVHLHFGLQYDFAKYVGLYASLGPNVSFVRSIGTELGGTIGVQARFP